MAKTQSFSEQFILDCLKVNYGIKVNMLTLLARGADMNAIVYKATACDQSAFFIKVKCGHHLDIGATVQSLLYKADIKQIIEPIKTIHDYPFYHSDDFTIIVYPFIEGQDAFSRNLTHDQWVMLGNVVRNIHDINLGLFAYVPIRCEDYSSKWRDSVRSLYTHIETVPNNDEITSKTQLFFKENAATINFLVDRSEQLAAKVQNQSSEFVLCHSDLHGGNVLVDQNDICHIVDWDNPILAPKERDLMFIGGGVGNTWNNLDEVKAFYKGYGNKEVNLDLLSYYRFERIVEDIALYGECLLFSKDRSQNHPEYYKHLTNQFKPQGVVDVALKTEEYRV